MEFLDKDEHGMPAYEDIQESQITNKQGYHQPSNSINSVCDCEKITGKGSYRIIHAETSEGNKTIYYHQRPIAQITSTHITIRIPPNYEKYKLPELLREILPRNYNANARTSGIKIYTPDQEIRLPRLGNGYKTGLKISKAEATAKNI